MKEFLVRALKLFHDYNWVYNFKALEILFPHNLQNIPNEIQDYFANSSSSAPQDLLNIVLSSQDHQKNLEQYPESLKDFIKACQELYKMLDSLIQNNFEENLLPQVIKLNKKWSEKKQKEVYHLSNFIQSVHKNHKSWDLIIDIGSGLGYLSTEISQKTSVEVLGIEADPSRSHSASTKFKNPHQSQSQLKTKTQVKNVNLKLSSNIVSQLEPYTVPYASICIIGLHSCGDLSPWSMDLFISSPKYSTLSIVPCCYHKMSLDSNRKVKYFPLSSLCKELYGDGEFLKGEQLGRLASQRPGADFLINVEKETMQIFYRAILELYVSTEKIELKKTRRRCGLKNESSQLLTFCEYVKSFSFTLEGDFESHYNNLTQLYEKMKCYESLVRGILGMQGSLQLLAECFILLDRIQFLNESGIVSEASLKRIIPKNITPRGFVLYAQK